MAYSNSPLASYTLVSPNRTAPRNQPISRITIHCFVGQVTAEQGANIKRFRSYDIINGASCNYVVGKDGDIALVVPESDRSWCSSNRDNDHKAVTIECASDTTHPYHVTDKALNAVIDLCTDICRRNGKTRAVWFPVKEVALNYKPKSGEMLFTVHRFFKNKACPGEYLLGKHDYIVAEVNKRLAGDVAQPAFYYIVQKGDTLSKIARMNGTTYQTLAAINGIKPPYIIKVGQKIKLQ